MNQRPVGFVSLLLVVGVSIVFGMLIGGRLNTPRVALASPGVAPLNLAPAFAVAPATGDFSAVVERAMPAVVSVTSTKLAHDGDAQGQGGRRGGEEPLWQWFFGPQQRRDFNHNQMPSVGEGSGFIISPDGYVLTNYHVVEGADQVEVGLQRGRDFKAQVVGTDRSIDLALLKIEPDGAELPALPLGNSRDLRVGEWVIAIGNPLEYEHSVTVGVVSAKERRVPIGSTDSGVVSFIQTDAAINFGNSGGPLLDGRGNVVGINTAIRRANYAEGIGFALPIDHARRVIEQLRERGEVRRGYLGINMNQNGIDENVRDYYGLPDTKGVLIERVTEGGPGERVGLRRGDIIRSVNGEPVRDNLDLISKISAMQPGDRVDLQVFRNGRTLRLEVALGDRGEALSAEAMPATPEEDPRNEMEEDLERHSEVLGFTVRSLTRKARAELGLEDDQQGVLVSEVDYDSEAADKGVRPNMVVTTVNDEPIGSIADWIDAVHRLVPGEPVKLEVSAGPRSFAFYLRVPDSLH